ncbi:medium-chain acyl-CoA ligase ACSF2, mitochondrial-like isoform X1 [Ornithodoros turicata]|uniref:medium-chain acyl-CoA ligase ACSF2, mitochondrial-like isoform X1 n=1 Tax=Ornithodoros turicata TaxID=34597 RepID=UPI00313A0849
MTFAAWRRLCVRSQWRRLQVIHRELSYYHRHPPAAPLISMTMADAIDRAAATYGDNVAITSCHQGLKKTYTQYKNDVDHLAAGFVSLGLPIGSAVGIIMANMYEWVVVLFAAAKAGLVLVNVNTACKVPELEYCLTKIDCRALVISDKFARQDYYRMLLEIAPELETSVAGELRSSRLPLLKHVIVMSNDSKPGTLSEADLLDSVTGEHRQEMHKICSRMQFDAPFNVQFTSGTTGKPKGALLSHFNILNNAYTVGRIMGYHKQQDSLCLNVPLVHCFSCVVGTICAALFGSTVVMPAPSFNGTAALKAISAEKCTTLYGTPTMFIDMMREVDTPGTSNDVSSVSKGVMSGAPCPPEVIKGAMQKLNVKRMQIVYGTTECSPVITATDPSEPLEKWIHTVGKAIDHVEVKIVDRENRIVPFGTIGELCARGYLVFPGYYGDEQKTRESVENNWYHTGDEATMSEDGHVTIYGRMKDMIIRGGENIYPREIEDVLYTHPHIGEVHVCGVPDARLGEEVCAWIKTKTRKTLEEDDVKSFCKERLSYFKVPKYIVFVDGFPKTVTGKIQKFKMREESVLKLKLKE